MGIETLPNTQYRDNQQLNQPNWVKGYDQLLSIPRQIFDSDNQPKKKSLPNENDRRYNQSTNLLSKTPRDPNQIIDEIKNEARNIDIPLSDTDQKKLDSITNSCINTCENIGEFFNVLSESIRDDGNQQLRDILSSWQGSLYRHLHELLIMVKEFIINHHNQGNLYDFYFIKVPYPRQYKADQIVEKLSTLFFSIKGNQKFFYPIIRHQLMKEMNNLRNNREDSNYDFNSRSGIRDVLTRMIKPTSKGFVKLPVVYTIDDYVNLVEIINNFWSEISNNLENPYQSNHTNSECYQINLGDNTKLIINPCQTDKRQARISVRGIDDRVFSGICYRIDREHNGKLSADFGQIDFDIAFKISQYYANKLSPERLSESGTTQISLFKNRGKITFENHRGKTQTVNLGHILALLSAVAMEKCRDRGFRADFFGYHVKLPEHGRVEENIFSSFVPALWGLLQIELPENLSI
jgi:hypothetical protein